jgi:hypothetical protein
MKLLTLLLKQIKKKGQEQLLTSVIPATLEAEIWKIGARGQTR